MKEWANANKEKINAAAKRWRERNPEKARAFNSSERKHTYHAAWYEANKTEKQAKNREWSKKNPAQHCANIAKRKLRIARACPPWADLDAIASVYEEARRKTVESGVEHHVDHIYPIKGKTVSGLHVAANLRVLQADANRRKSNRLIEWN